jgi:hypothetical protein
MPGQEQCRHGIGAAAESLSTVHLGGRNSYRNLSSFFLYAAST